MKQKANQGKTIKDRFSGLLSRLSPPAEQPGAPMTMPPSAKGDTAFRLSGILTLGIVLLVAFFGFLLGGRAYGQLGLGSNQYKNQPVVYLQNGTTLKFSHPFLETPVTITDKYEVGSVTGSLLNEQAITVSADGKRLLYQNNLLQGTGDLYIREISREKPGYGVQDSQGLPIAKGVGMGTVRFVRDDREAIYLKKPTEGEGWVLCHWSRRDGEEILDTGVMQLAAAMPNDKLCYLVNVNGQRTLRVINMGEKTDENIIRDVETAAEIILYVDKNNSNQVVYQVQTKAGEYDIKLLTEEETPRVLATGVHSIVDLGAKGELFYLRAVPEEFNPMAFFEDDMATQDVLLAEPVEEDFMVEKKSLWGKVTKSLDTKAYEAAQTAYADKLIREEIRKTITSKTQQYTSYTLGHTVGSSQTVVDTGLRQVDAADAANATAIYYKSRSSIGEKVKISSVLDPQDALRMVATIMGNITRDYYYVRLGTEPAMFQTVPKNEPMTVVPDGGKGIYFTRQEPDGPPDAIALYYASSDGDGLSSVKKLDDNVIGLENRRFDGQILYQRAGSGGTAALYSLNGGKKTLLVDGFSNEWGFGIEGSTLATMANYDSGRATGELSLYNGKARYLSRDVNDYSYRTDDFVYMLMNYEQGTGSGDLALYKGNSQKLTLIDRNVTFLNRGDAARKLRER